MGSALPFVLRVGVAVRCGTGVDMVEGICGAGDGLRHEIINVSLRSEDTCTNDCFCHLSVRLIDSWRQMRYGS